MAQQLEEPFLDRRVYAFNTVVSELMAGVAAGTPKLVDAKNVLIWGGSAGASGARRSMDHMAATIWAAQAGAKNPRATIKRTTHFGSDSLAKVLARWYTGCRRPVQTRQAATGATLVAS